MEHRKIKILQIVQEPVTIWAFLIGLIKELEKRGYEVEAACNDSNLEIVNELKKEEIKLNLVDIKKSINPLSILKAFMEFRRLFKEKKFDVVVAHTPIVAFASRFAAYFCKVPVIIYTAHGLPFMKGMNPLKNFLFYFMEKLAGKVTTGLICINDEDYQMAIDKKLTKIGHIKKINGIGVDTDRFKPLESSEKERVKQRFLKSVYNNLSITPYSLPRTPKIVGFIGRFVKSKGIIEYLKMAKNISGYRDDIVFVVAGFGPLKDYVKAYVTENNLSNKIIYIGFEKDVTKLLSVMNVFVLPTYYPEGIPRTILESMAMKVPVITTDIRGCRELVDNEKTGLIVNVGDVGGLQKAVERLVDDDVLREVMGQASRKKIVEKYEEVLVINEQIKFYEELIKERV